MSWQDDKVFYQPKKFFLFDAAASKPRKLEDIVTTLNPEVVMERESDTFPLKTPFVAKSIGEFLINGQVHVAPLSSTHRLSISLLSCDRSVEVSQLMRASGSKQDSYKAL